MSSDTTDRNNESVPRATMPGNSPAPRKMSLSRRWADKFIHGKGIFTFLRSSVSSQIASWTDMCVCFVFYAWVFMPMGVSPMRSFLATAVGLVVGGVVNCFINYKFTFRADNCPVKAVAFKYLLIWGGSFILNIAGTTALTHLLQQIPWDRISLPFGIEVKSDGIFAASRLTVSLIVSLAWNFLMQKNFVYIPTRFDSTAIKIIDCLTLHHRHGAGNNAGKDSDQGLNTDSDKEKNG